MEFISSRKNKTIARLRALQSDSTLRNELGLYVCDGMKNLSEAISFGVHISEVLWKDKPLGEIPAGTEEYCCPADLFEYVSPLKNSPGPVFTAAIPAQRVESGLRRVIVLENVQDPGNVGTVIRTANAFRMDAVVLVGDCADLYNPKTVRATMGAIFRQNVLRCTHSELAALLKNNSLKLYGAALAEDSTDMRRLTLDGAAVAIGSEGRGLSDRLLSMCDKKLIIPMNPDSESLNAGVAASVIMWEMMKTILE